MTEYKETWIKVFHHFTQYGYFSSINDAISSDEPGRFSRLSSITDTMKIDDGFEFRLEYPQNGFVYHWKQTVNPLKINEGKLNSKNYSQILQPPTSEWRGYLAISDSECTVLDGMSADNQWWFSIGTIKCTTDPYFNNYPGTLPGPYKIGVKEVVLWLRVPIQEIRDVCYTRRIFIAAIVLFT